MAPARLRDSRGRFAEMPDAPKPASSNSSAQYQVRTGRKLRNLLKAIEEEQKSIRAAREEIRASMNAKQRRRLNNTLAYIKMSPTEASPVINAASEALSRAATGDVAPKRKGKGGVRVKAEISEGVLKVAIPAHDGSFKVYEVPNYKYQVPVKDGRTVELNSYSRAMEFLGEKVLGVPPILKDYKKASNDELLGAMELTLSGMKRGTAVNVDPNQHKVHKGDLNPDLGYMGWQIHHVDQWYKNPPIKVEADFASGKITDDQRIALYKENLRPAREERSGYEIAPVPSAQRAFVMLPGGQHQAMTPFFRDVHPPIPHPDTGKMTMFGIPKGTSKDGESRKWFDSKFRTQFWKEYYKNESQEIAAEINRRLKSGALTEADAKKLLSNP